MFYVISDGVPGSDGPPFLFYKFKDLRVASKAMGVLANPEMLCNLVVYNDDSLESLKENYKMSSIDNLDKALIYNIFSLIKEFPFDLSIMQAYPTIFASK